MLVIFTNLSLMEFQVRYLTLFLSNRQVVLDEKFSQKYPVNARVPQAALKIHLSSQQLWRVLLRQTVFLQKSPWQKYCQGNYFIAKYIFSLQYLILISRQNDHLQTRDKLYVLEKCLYVLQEVRSIIYFILYIIYFIILYFIHPLYLCSRCNGTSFAFRSYIIVLAKFCNITFLNNFFFTFLPFFHLLAQKKKTCNIKQKLVI